MKMKVKRIFNDEAFNNGLTGLGHKDMVGLNLDLLEVSSSLFKSPLHECEIDYF